MVCFCSTISCSFQFHAIFTQSTKVLMSLLVNHVIHNARGLLFTIPKKIQTVQQSSHSDISSKYSKEVRMYGIKLYSNYYSIALTLQIVSSRLVANCRQN